MIYGFYKGDDYLELQNKYDIEKEQKFKSKMAKFNIKPLNEIILDIENKVQEHDCASELSQIAKKASKYFAFIPSKVESEHLSRL